MWSGEKKDCDKSESELCMKVQHYNGHINYQCFPMSLCGFHGTHGTDKVAYSCTDDLVTIKKMEQDEVHSHDHTSMLVILFLFIQIFIGQLLKAFSNWTTIPYTSLLFIAGVMIGHYHEDLGGIGIGAY